MRVAAIVPCLAFGGPRAAWTAVVAGVAAGCSGTPRTPSPSPVADVDPVGAYELVLSWEGGVQDGRMEIRGGPGGWRGTIEAGSLAVRIHEVKVEGGRLTISGRGAAGVVVFRLAADGELLSGEWVAGGMRGGVTAIRIGREGLQSRAERGGPVSTGRSVRAPHSAQEPS